MHNTALRSDEIWNALQSCPKKDECFLCGVGMKIVTEYKHWYICENDFPYDRVATKHHMLVPREHVAVEERLSQDARFELIKIFWELDRKSGYDAIMRNFERAQSHTAHLHYHLLTYIRA